MRRTLTELHNNYILVPVDKATDNVSTISQMFYTLALVKKLGLDRYTRNDINSKYETFNHTQVDC